MTASLPSVCRPYRRVGDNLPAADLVPDESVATPATIAVFCRTGLRIAELRHLRPEDVDFRYNTVRVIYAATEELEP